jgi:hypothetical protein
MIAADGVLNALDYTRSCTCSYAHQTSLALVHMPGDANIEFWTRHDAARPNPAGHGLNFGAPGRRVDDAGRIWHHASGTHRRHASAIADDGGSIAWVAASAREADKNASASRSMTWSRATTRSGSTSPNSPPASNPASACSTC